MVSGYTKKRERKYWLLFGAALLVLIPDILTKWLAQKFIPPQEAIAVIPGFFDLVNIRNRGAAFGFLNRSDIEWQFWLFLAATILAFIVIIYMIRQSSKQPLLALGLGMVLGGATGNLLDRIRYRAVVDFLDFYWQNWHWPAFNVADMGICLGAFLACISAWRKSPAARI